jgi:hypothetical protein
MIVVDARAGWAGAFAVGADFKFNRNPAASIPTELRFAMHSEVGVSRSKG